VHRLLERQLRRCFGSMDAVPKDLAPFLEKVEEAYRLADRDRALSERSLELTSRELLEQNARLRALLGGIPDELIIIDGNGKILAAHQSGAPDLAALADLVGHHLAAYLPPALAEEALEHVWAVNETGVGRSWHFSVTREGEERTYEVRFQPEQPGQVLAMLRDITQTRKLSAQLDISARMASVGTMAAGVAHEINNPLTYVLANLEHVHDELTLLERHHDIEIDADLREAMANAISGAKRVRRIVRELKTFSRGEDEGSGTADLHEVIDSAGAIAYAEIRNRARFVKHYGDVPMVEGDSAKLGQVFLNLLVNAAQALPLGRVAENVIEVVTRRSGDFVVVEVRDSGPGIPSDVRDRIFEPFYTTKSRTVGTGLGLSICRSIVVAVGGRISVESSREGTVFRVELKEARPRLVSKGSAHPSSAPPVEAIARILVIDDEPDVRKSMRRVLRPHRVTLAAGGEEAWKQLAARNFDVILCDIVMPDLTGIELFERTLSERPEFADRFVFMTGGSFTAETRHFLEHRAPAQIEKPFDVSDLRAVITDALARTQAEPVVGTR
jgi:signal transduction histidine kinase/ActR/RegA family two-component response regulator